MAKKTAIDILNSDNNIKKVKNLLKKKSYLDNRPNKIALGISITQEMLDFLHRKSFAQGISISAFVANLISIYAKTEGENLDLGFVRKRKAKKKPE